MLKHSLVILMFMKKWRVARMVVHVSQFNDIYTWLLYSIRTSFFINFFLFILIVEHCLVISLGHCKNHCYLWSYIGRRKKDTELWTVIRWTQWKCLTASANKIMLQLTLWYWPYTSVFCYWHCYLWFMIYYFNLYTFKK